ncbi:hypothetical protein TrST_g587 [Triparma strigata]|uniref:Uncharacterized protein n=1 Tax=Triparma strigata TaxID=1606541 RepID=A0A9W7EFH5_9STRA|nr:hypothetical protein TrST_g587 [Triparma strigata]
MLRPTFSYLFLFLLLLTPPVKSSADSSNRVTEPASNLEIVENADGEVDLPGHAGDARGLPNLPFAVESNRKSDGVSSISPWTATSPSFPLYKGGASVHDPTPRKDHEASTVLSRVNQGVAPKGSGEFERAQARLQSLVSSTSGYSNDNVPLDTTTGAWSGSTPSASALPTTTFTVSAGTRWNPSNFAIQAGETYRIDVAASETWSDDSGDITVDSLGYDSYYDVAQKCHVAEGRCRSYVRGKLRFTKSNWMHLVCGVGNAVTLLQEAGEDVDRFLPLREAEFLEGLFAVDLTYTFEANPGQNGELVCFANDSDGLYYDNSGSIQVTVTRTSWPPNMNFDDNYVEYLKKALENPSKFDEYVSS